MQTSSAQEIANGIKISSMEKSNGYAKVKQPINFTVTFRNKS